MNMARGLMLGCVLLGVAWGVETLGMGPFGLVSGGIVGGAGGALAVHLYAEFLALQDKLEERREERSLRKQAPPSTRKEPK